MIVGDSVEDRMSKEDPMQQAKQDVENWLASIFAKAPSSPSPSKESTTRDKPVSKS
jgi:hypothetical protein